MDFTPEYSTLHPKHGDYMDCISVVVYKTDKHTPKWLKERGGKY